MSILRRGSSLFQDYPVKKSLLILAATLVLSACTSPTDSGSGSAAPQVSSLIIGFDDRSNSRFASVPTGDVYRNFLIGLQTPSLHGSVSRIEVRDSSGLMWAKEGSALQDLWNPDRGRFEFWSYYSTSSLTRAPLGTYTVTVQQQGRSDTVFTMDAFRDHDPTLNSGLVHSVGSGGTPRFAEAPTNLGATLESTGVRITADAIPDTYGWLFFWLYDANGNWISTHQVAWPLTSAQHTDLDVLEAFSADELAQGDYVVVGLISQPETIPARSMMYRYFERFYF